MAEIAVTIVGNNLNTAVENSAAQLIKGTGADDLSIQKLHPGYAIDILVKQEETPALMAVLREKLSGLGSFDIFVQPNDFFRRKKLLVADMDATIVQQETLDELAAHYGIKDKIAPITEKAMRGEIDFSEALERRVKMLEGLPLGMIMMTLRNVEYSKGAAALVKTMNRHGARCVLVSGGFDLFTRPVGESLGFYKSYGNVLEVVSSALTGNIIPPIIDKHAKERVVIKQAQELGLGLKHIVAIGDGANDIPMLMKAGTGIGYFAKPAVQEATPHQIRHTDLLSVLYMQGFRQEELAL